jgi:L-2-hydroxyglutarate oxidase LhgO
MQPETYDIDTLVIGAGAVGLAIAAALCRTSDVIVVEQTDRIGAGTSSRNSEVIHAGMYYATGSHKQRLCISGRRLLYPYLESRKVAFRTTEKFIVATETGEVPQLEALAARGVANGVEGLSLIGQAEATRLEPELRCSAALWSRETGIFDSHGFMLALEGDLRDRGGDIAFETSVRGIEIRNPDGFWVSTMGREPVRISCRRLVNAAGLHAQGVARTIDGIDFAHVPDLVLAKGSYFSLTGRCPFGRLIYPAPVDGGLGIHLTLDLAGQARFGPDVEWLAHADPERIDYSVDARRRASFERAIRRYWPGLPADAIVPAYSGCRPKVAAHENGVNDFVISGPEDHGIPGLVNLFAIESPGLTSALALAELVAATIAE